MPVEEEVSITNTEARVLQSFKDILVVKEGLHEVSIPWKEAKTDLKDNHKQAENTLFSLERKPVQDPDKAKCYREAMSKYLVDGVAEEVPYAQISLGDGCPLFYLQHHAVDSEDKQTTKTRVVFDASARDSNVVPLNSCLEAGHVPQESSGNNG